jgi:uncharacterized membrane protein YidH (DUF202 family)
MSDTGPGELPAVAGLQHERTTLAWERTAFALMGIGVILGRFAAVSELWLVEPLAIVLVLIGAAVLVWAGAFYERRSLAIELEHDVAHPGAARLVGIVTLAACAVSLVAAVVVVVRDLGWLP